MQNADHAAIKFANFVTKIIMEKIAFVKLNIFLRNGQMRMLESKLKSALNVQHIQMVTHMMCPAIFVLKNNVELVDLILIVIYTNFKKFLEKMELCAFRS